MKTKILFAVVMLFFSPLDCRAFDLGDIEKQLGQSGIDKALQSMGVDLEQALGYLNWETINVSLTADLTSTTDSRGRHLQVSAKAYKREISNVRLDIQGALNIPREQAPLTLQNVYVLNYPLRDTSFLIAPERKGFIELDGEKSEELFGRLKHKLEEKDSKVEKKEKLGTETIEGYLCDKVHMIVTQENGTRNDITAWLARDLQNFPLKAIVDFTTARGITGTSLTEFKNIEKTVPDKALFELPEGFTKYDTLLQLATGTKAGSRIKKVRERDKKVRRR